MIQPTACIIFILEKRLCCKTSMGKSSMVQLISHIKMGKHLREINLRANYLPTVKTCSEQSEPIQTTDEYDLDIKPKMQNGARKNTRLAEVRMRDETGKMRLCEQPSAFPILPQVVKFDDAYTKISAPIAKTRDDGTSSIIRPI